MAPKIFATTQHLLLCRRRRQDGDDDDDDEFDLGLCDVMKKCKNYEN